jgi:hypothetical protein
VGAVFKDADGSDYVMLAGSDGHAHRKTAQIGIRNKEFAQVVSGINPGDPVISTGGYGLPDNTQIKIEAPASAEKDAGDKAEKGKAQDADDEKKPAGKGKE